MMARAVTLLMAAWLFVTGIESQELAGTALPQYAVAIAVLVAELIALRWDSARWVSFMAGLWLLVAPFVFEYRSSLNALNSYSVGLIIMVLAIYADRPATYTVPSTYNRELYAYQGGGRAYR